MKKAVVVAGISAAFLVVAPSAALATAPPTPSTSAAPTSEPEYPDGPMTRVTKQLSLHPGKALPGARVKFDFGCSTRPEEDVDVRSAALVADKPGFSFGTVKNVKPGKYSVTLHCGPETSTATLEVLAKQPAKQVTKVPAGAPQTGGTDGPVDGSGAPVAAAAAMGVLALGGSGLVLARRVRRR
ncbi:hypothetical protein ABJI51_32875 [Amycolatopsis sp. NEAU-NG30]|uniref:Gram-positive cocci surface proteins LPxTG domain-containing protein n=1 Tax=Amycolatopsis melonis TaxID=3156488 RepID=A0ABV0LNM7_9PSEU